MGLFVVYIGWGGGGGGGGIPFFCRLSADLSRHPMSEVPLRGLLHALGSLSAGSQLRWLV